MRKENFMKTAALTVILVLFFNSPVYSQSPAKFRKLLAGNELRFEMPEGYLKAKVRKNGDLFYNYALKKEGEAFEVRYSILSLESFVKDYEKSLSDPDIIVADPNKLGRSLFMVNVLNVSQSGMEKVPQLSYFPPDAVRAEFGADDGGTSFFAANSEFSEGYTFCLMVYIHRDNVADVYISFLGDEPEVIERNALAIFHAIGFKQE